MTDKKVDESDLFLEMLVAAMEDAVTTGHITQLQTSITPESTGKPKLVRILVVPEEMEIVRRPGEKFQRPA